jgi:hypothetical protein
MVGNRKSGIWSPFLFFLFQFFMFFSLYLSLTLALSRSPSLFLSSSLSFLFTFPSSLPSSSSPTIILLFCSYTPFPCSSFFFVLLQILQCGNTRPMETLAWGIQHMFQVLLHVGAYHCRVLDGTLPCHLPAHPLIHYVQSQDRLTSHSVSMGRLPSQCNAVCCLHQDQLRGISTRYEQFIKCWSLLPQKVLKQFHPDHEFITYVSKCIPWL